MRVRLFVARLVMPFSQLTANRLSCVVFSAAAPPPPSEQPDFLTDLPPSIPLPQPPGSIEVRALSHVWSTSHRDCNTGSDVDVMPCFCSCASKRRRVF